LTNARDVDPETALLAAYQTPIEFYGKVVDQHSDPVSGASVMILPFDNACGEATTQIKLTSDEEGRSSWNAARMAGMSLEAGLKAGLANWLKFG